MQEAGLVSLSGVQINGRFCSPGAAEPAPVSLKNQKSTKKKSKEGQEERKLERQKVRPRAHPAVWTGAGRG